ncbi:3'-5' exonuclease [Roseateles asaccharophilus]|uniref:Ribonuclease D n=1 Tax=Roseateles asaccharophilus TaxID=582607 RepID=A0ABU2AD04_9BURK|nr:3'-5' exonuclease [Roseateles asaccharophilus]MDR7334377.1 ribonuclease D [Roseateles asaccharophilus]
MRNPPPLPRPTPEQIAALPPYPALPVGRIHLLKTPEQLEFAAAALRAAGHVGFDTESKPTFVAGAPQTGPEVIQFATPTDAFIVQTATPGVEGFLQAMIESDDVVKVGFGLASDRPQIYRKLGLRLGASIDVSQMVKRLGFKDAVGLKTAVAVVLGQRFTKSKKATTSNWANKTLTPQQLQYAANDAHASLLVYQALETG